MDPINYGHFPTGPAHPPPSALAFDEFDPMFFELGWTAQHPQPSSLQPKMLDPNSLDYVQYTQWAEMSGTNTAIGLPPLYEPSGQFSAPTSYPEVISINDDQLVLGDVTTSTRSALHGSNSSYSDGFSAYASPSHSPSNVSLSPFPTSPLSLSGGTLSASPAILPINPTSYSDNGIDIFNSYDMFLSTSIPSMSLPPRGARASSLSTVECSPTPSQISLYKSDKIAAHKSTRPRSSTGASGKRKSIHGEATCAESRANACTKCPQRFARARDLKRHFRLHTGEKPYRCGACGMGFIRSDARGRHFASSPACARLHEQT